MAEILIKKPLYPINIHVGGKIRRRRLELGMSQEVLGEGINLSFQQVQKYEKGVSGLNCNKLGDIADVLGVNFYYFFQGFPVKGESVSNTLEEDRAKFEYEDIKVPLRPYKYSKRPITDPDIRAIAESIGDIQDPVRRSRLINIIGEIIEQHKLF